MVEKAPLACIKVSYLKVGYVLKERLRGVRGFIGRRRGLSVTVRASALKMFMVLTSQRQR